MMAGSLETALAYLLAFGLFAVPYWWVHAIWCRRCVAAARRAAAEMEGRYETGGQFSGGRIYGRKDGRDVVVDFSPLRPRQPVDRRGTYDLILEDAGQVVTPDWGPHPWGWLAGARRPRAAVPGERPNSIRSSTSGDRS